MKLNLKAMLIGAALVAGLAPAAAYAACADLNNDGNVTITDATILSGCLAGPCPPASPPLTPGPLCGTGSLAACGDTLADGTVDNADLAALVDSLAGLETLFDLCTGPGPDIVGCPGPVSIGASGDVTISTNQTWPSGCTIKLEDTVFVADGTVLTLEPGVIVEGESGNTIPVTPALIFLPGSKINAQGTPSQPIVFTSDKAPGTRGKGDWGGVQINGRSTVNREDCQGTAEGLPVAFGGCIENDSSGIARYVRVEYAGLDFTPNNELNLWTMNALGSGTVIDHVHTNVGDDDCLEWFGGTINTHHMVASGCADDGFDFQLGFTGSVQYGLMLQRKDLTDLTPNPRDSRGIEADNSEFGNNDLPRSNPKFCNMTLVSDNSSDAATTGSDVGMLFRRGTAGTFANMIVVGYQDAGLELRDQATTQQACVDTATLAGNLTVENTIFYHNGTVGGSVNEHCKTGNPCINNTTGANTSTECTGAGAPYACCTGAGTGCSSCKLNSECPGGHACGIRNATCSSCDYYALLVANKGVINAEGSNATNPGQDENWPASGNLYNAKPTGTLPAAADCTLISDNFEDSGYVGAFDPSGPATGWLSQPWNSFDLN